MSSSAPHGSRQPRRRDKARSAPLRPETKTAEAKPPEAEVEEGAPISAAELRGVERLLDEGRRKGFLTLEQVNGALPEMVSSDQIDEVLTLFGDNDIEVVDALRPRPRPAPAPRYNTREAEDPGSTNDPVRVYLREMGQVSLLTREGEVTIAQRIESGIESQIRAVLATPFGLAEVLRLGDEHRKGHLALEDILDGLDEAEGLD
jgi:RNA polymerase primary sigma factor